MHSSMFSKSIESEAEYRQASRALSQKKQPSKMLRLLMNSFESYRQSRKYGWSRPWNKIDLMNFQSFKLDLQAFPEFANLARSFLRHKSLKLPTASQQFVQALLDDPSLMGFIFVHEYTHMGFNYEGATLSLGRIHEKRYRDRIDIIVEAPVVDCISQGLERARIYIDPYRQDDKQPLWQGEIQAFENAYSFAIFAALSNVSWDWANEEKHCWDHWTSTYIDYFGDRKWTMKKSFFHVEGQDDCRIEIDIPDGIDLQTRSSLVLEGAA